MTDHLYFLHSATTETIKIGRGQNPLGRLAYHRSVYKWKHRITDLKLMAIFRGRGEDEQIILQRWRKYRIKGELFRATSDLCEWIDSGCKLEELPYPTEIGGNLREARRVAGLSQVALAVKLWSDRRRQSDVSAYETGAVCPDIPTLRRIAAALGVSVSTLIEEK